MVDTTSRFSCNGIVRAWKCFANRPGTLFLQVWRKNDLIYTLVGGSSIYVRGGYNRYPCITPIVVQTNDILGWAFGKKVVIGFQSGGHTIRWCKIHKQRKQFGMSYSFPYSDRRTYPIQAVFQPIGVNNVGYAPSGPGHSNMCMCSYCLYTKYLGLYCFDQLVLSLIFSYCGLCLKRNKMGKFTLIPSEDFHDNSDRQKLIEKTKHTKIVQKNNKKARKPRLRKKKAAMSLRKFHDIF